MKKIAIIFLLSTVMLSSLVFAHPGRTDEYGGHYDASTGEYHYHHGYPAHQHPNGICPYDKPVTSSDSTTNVEKANRFKHKLSTRGALIVGLVIVLVIFLKLVKKNEGGTDL